MNTPIQNMASSKSAFAEEAEATLRLIASLPAPEGIEGRVEAALRAAPRRTGFVHRWTAFAGPGQRWMQNALVRGAAAAAIVLVVAGGGWSVYSRVQPAQTSKVITVPRAAASGGFSNSGAMRTPQTLSGPVLVHRGSKAPKRAGIRARLKVRAADKELKTGPSNRR